MAAHDPNAMRSRLVNRPPGSLAAAALAILALLLGAAATPARAQGVDAPPAAAPEPAPPSGWEPAAADPGPIPAPVTAPVPVPAPVLPVTPPAAAEDEPEIDPPGPPADVDAPDRDVDPHADPDAAPLLGPAPTIPPDAGVPAAPPDAGAAAPAAEPAVAPEQPLEPPGAKSTEQKATVVIKLVVGLVILMVLAYLGGHRRVVAWQERIGLGGVIAAGFPFLALGLIMRQPEIGVLTDDVVRRLQPILHFGLGWLGFIIGAQLDIRVLDKVPAGTAYLIVVEALAPFAFTAAAVGGIMLTFGRVEWNDPVFWRDMIVLGAAAAMTAPRRFRGFANRTWREGRGVDHLLAQLDEIVGVIGLLFVAAYFRPEVSSGWQLPGTAWVFVSIGLGVVIGVLIFAIVRVPVSNAEFLAVVLGSIAFGAGLAGYLYLSPIVVCFLAGVLVTNFPCDQRDSIFKILNHLERPIHLLFLIVVGATWDVFDWHAWLLVPVFVIARMSGKWAGIFAATRTVGGKLPPGYADERKLVTPVSALAIALVISLYGIDPRTTSLVGEDGASHALWITTVVIGGAILTELIVSVTTPPRAARARTPIPMLEPPTGIPRAPAAPDAIDELDEPSSRVEAAAEAGPVYRDPDDDEHPPMVPRPPTKAEGDA